MRIVALSDTHTFERQLGALPDGDLLVHAGDLLRVGGSDELEEVAGWLRALPFAHKVVVAGNHDWCFQREPDVAREILGREVIYLEDSGAIVEGLRFWGSPWQPGRNRWAYTQPDDAARAERWALIPDDTDVLVTHCPPHGVGDRDTFAGPIGCPELGRARRRVRPALHLFGHVHQDGGFWREGDLALANVTTWECERGPTVLDIDPRTREVAAVEVPPPDRPAWREGAPPSVP